MRALLTWSLCLVASAAFALDPATPLDQFSVDVFQGRDGLPQNTVQSLVQTRDGYLWIATEEGLARFDGVRFTVFDRSTLPGSNVLPLVEGAEGSLWAGLYGGGLVQLDQGRLVRGWQVREGLLNDTVTALAAAADGVLWVGTASGLHRLEAGRVSAARVRDRVRCLLVDRRGTLWVGTPNGLTRASDGRSFGIRDGLAGEVINALAEDASGALWVGTSSGLSRIQDDRIQSFATKDGLPGDFVRAVHFDRHGCLWIGTEHGLARYVSGRFSTLTTAGGLSGDLVSAILEDREGSLWVGTIAGGLNRLREGPFVTYGTRQGLRRDHISVVLSARAGGLWIGGTDGQLMRFQNGRFADMGSQTVLHEQEVRALHEDAAGTLWIGTATAGLYTWRAGRFDTAPGLASVRDVRVIASDASGGLWFGTDSNGLFHRDPAGRLVHYGTDEGSGGLPDGRVRVIHSDRGGRMWIGTYGGLCQLVDGRFTAYTTAQGLPSNLVRSIHEDAAGVLWIGTYGGGIARLKQGRLTPYTTRQGLFNDVAYAIVEDAVAQLWVSGNRGVFRVAKAELDALADGSADRVRSVAYNEADGMASAECNGGAPAAWRTDDGRLWFATVKGLAVVDPARLNTNPQPPPVVVEALLVDGVPADLGSEIELAPGAQRLEFHYTGLSLLAPAKVRFRYRLLGLDRDWVEAGTLRAAWYTNLAPKDYRFEVIACNNDGVWNQAGASVSFRLRPRVWEAGWFRGLAAIGLALAIAGAWHLRTRSLSTRATELARLVEERTADLREAVRQKDEVVGIVAHDFRSPLTSIQGYAELLEMRAPDDPDMRRITGAIRRQVVHLASLAADTLTMSRIETGQLPLDPQSVSLLDLLRSAIEDGTAEWRGNVALVPPAADDGYLVWADAHWIRQVLDNLIGNAVKYSPDGAEVRVSLVQAPDAVQVSVSDRGLGIGPDDIARLFRKFSRLDAARQGKIKGTGLGLYICRSIVEAHRGRIWVESEPGHGSTFHFTLPRTRPEAAGTS